jgi:hypothetical protein
MPKTANVSDDGGFRVQIPNCAENLRIAQNNVRLAIKIPYCQNTCHASLRGVEIDGMLSHVPSPSSESKPYIADVRWITDRRINHRYKFPHFRDKRPACE